MSKDGSCSNSLITDDNLSKFSSVIVHIFSSRYACNVLIDCDKMPFGSFSGESMLIREMTRQKGAPQAYSLGRILHLYRNLRHMYAKQAICKSISMKFPTRLNHVNIMCTLKNKNSITQGSEYSWLHTISIGSETNTRRFSGNVGTCGVQTHFQIVLIDWPS